MGSVFFVYVYLMYQQIYDGFGPLGNNVLILVLFSSPYIFYIVLCVNFRLEIFISCSIQLIHVLASIELQYLIKLKRLKMKPNCDKLTSERGRYPKYALASRHEYTTG